jgi:hypothetical protein
VKPSSSTLMMGVVDYSSINKESVAWAFENANGLLRAELERVGSLNDKAAQLAGFAGVILAILGSVARDGFRAELGSVGEVAFAIFYFGAALLLALAILWLVSLVYRPRRYVAVDPEEIRNYLSDDRLLRAEPWALQIRTLRAIHPAAEWAEKGASQMAHRIGIGAMLFVGGLVAFLGAVLTMGAGSL